MAGNSTTNHRRIQHLSENADFLASVCGRGAGKVKRRAERSVKRIAAAAKRPATEPQTEARRTSGPWRKPARDERAVLRRGAGMVERYTNDRQPVERSKPRVGHGRTIRRAFLSQLRDGILCRGQILELLWPARSKFCECLADFDWIKRGHKME